MLRLTKVVTTTSLCLFMLIILNSQVNNVDLSWYNLLQSFENFEFVDPFNEFTAISTQLKKIVDGFDVYFSSWNGSVKWYDVIGLLNKFFTSISAWFRAVVNCLELLVVFMKCIGLFIYDAFIDIVNFVRAMWVFLRII